MTDVLNPTHCTEGYPEEGKLSAKELQALYSLPSRAETSRSDNREKLGTTAVENSFRTPVTSYSETGAYPFIDFDEYYEDEAPVPIAFADGTVGIEPVNTAFDQQLSPRMSNGIAPQVNIAGRTVSLEVKGYMGITNSHNPYL